MDRRHGHGCRVIILVLGAGLLRVAETTVISRLSGRFGRRGACLIILDEVLVLGSEFDRIVALRAAADANDFLNEFGRLSLPVRQRAELLLASVLPTAYLGISVH